MSTTPPLDQQWPPPATSAARISNSGHGSVGPTIAVLAAITILGILAGMIGRLCSGRTIMGHGQKYDFEAWVDRKCATCLDGSVDVPKPPARLPENVAGGNSGDHVPVEIQERPTPARE